MEQKKSVLRVSDEIPWSVKIIHAKEYPARMLRALSRRRAGQELTDLEKVRLDAWLEKLESDHSVIGYDPNSVFGFYYIEKDDLVDGKDGIPIRRAPINIKD